MKNAVTDGVMIAARLLYFPFIEHALKDESMFETSLTEALKMEKISSFSIKEKAQI